MFASVWIGEVDMRWRPAIDVWHVCVDRWKTKGSLIGVIYNTLLMNLE
jgi:hypothetical protein